VPFRVEENAGLKDLSLSLVADEAVNLVLQGVLAGVGVLSLIGV
jgi:hypothetical protein